MIADAIIDNWRGRIDNACQVRIRMEIARALDAFAAGRTPAIPPMLPINPKDEAIVDAFMAKRQRDEKRVKLTGDQEAICALTARVAQLEEALRTYWSGSAAPRANFPFDVWDRARRTLETGNPSGAPRIAPKQLTGGRKVIRGSDPWRREGEPWVT